MVLISNRILEARGKRIIRYLLITMKYIVLDMRMLIKKFYDRYTFIESEHSEERPSCSMGEQIMENPCSYESVEKVYCARACLVFGVCV